MLYHQLYGELWARQEAQSSVPNLPQPIAPPPTAIPVCAALELINSVTSAEAMQPIPTVGKGAGKVIYQARPENGYSSLDELPAAIWGQPYNCKRDVIASWEG